MENIDRLTMRDVVTIERLFRELLEFNDTTMLRYLGCVTAFMDVLELHEFVATRYAVDALAALRVRQDGDLDTTSKISESQKRHIRGILASVVRVLDGEFAGRRITELHPEVISGPIRSFPSTLAENGLSLSEDQKVMYNDTVRCLSVGSYRPAVVMGWALSIDIVRQWVYCDADRLSVLNTRLQSCNQPAIVDYDQFFPIGDDALLTHLRKSQGSLACFTDKIQRALQGPLDKRNSYAHANYKQCTSSKAVAAIEEMIDVLVEVPFKNTAGAK